MADNAGTVSSGLINSASLSDAYAIIFSALDHNCLKATAAFVSCFAVKTEVLFDCWDMFDTVAELNPEWFKHILAALKTGKTEGWSGNVFYEQMRNAGHEIAWHGTTHQPLDNAVSKKIIEQELLLTSILFKELGQHPATVIFPRNQVGHLDALQRYGFKTYRQDKPRSILGRVGNLLVEFNALARGSPDIPKMRDGWFVSPAGDFLNWPSGVRSLVPVSLTVQRWKSILKHAVETGGYVHMWFHPHNLITSPAMVESFTAVMDYVGELVRSGDLVSLTIEESNSYFATR